MLKACWIQRHTLLTSPAPVLKASPKPWPLYLSSLLPLLLLLCSPWPQRSGRRRPTDIITRESGPAHNLSTKSTFPVPAAGPKDMCSLTQMKDPRFKIHFTAWITCLKTTRKETIPYRAMKLTLICQGSVECLNISDN